MKVVIFCGGLGTRLKEETEFKPKPIVNIGNRPILWHIMKIYSHYGFNEFILCLGYKGDMIKEYFYNYDMLNNDSTIELGKNKITCHNSHKEDWKVTLVNTGLTALKGARLKQIEKYIIDDTFMATYGDGLANVNIAELLKFHNSHGKIATLTGVHTPSRFGAIDLDKNQIKQFIEKPKLNSYINGGFFVFNKKIFDHLTTDDSCDLENIPLTNLASQNELMMYKHDDEWQCLDTIRDMEYLNKLWNTNKAFWKV